MIGRKETLRRWNSKPETKARKREWYLKNKEKVHARQRAYIEANPEIRKATALRYHYRKTYGLSDIPEKTPCIRCGSKNRIHIHHRDGNNGRMGKPLNNSLSNLVMLCNSCHSIVHSRGRLRELV